MHWPSFADYEFFVKNAFDYSVLDPMLKNGEPMRGISGGFSRVYPVKVASRTFALRCWVKNVSDAKHRYEKIAAYLKQVGLPYFVDFEYVPEGILVNGIQYPITRMEWVEGVSLREFIEQNLQNPHIFKSVADEFQKMVSTLHKHEIAHGDLQDGNILLKQNSNSVKIKLIDYDSLVVPALQGQPEQIVGLPEYQHPKRIVGGGQVNEKVDYFSELVIYLSFLSLSENPILWTQFGDEKRVDRGLLFSKEDFDSDRSDIFQALEKLSPDVQQLAETLKDFCDKTSIDQLAPLEAILANTHCNQGESFLSDERYDEAFTEFQKAIDLKPNYARANRGIGRVYLHTKQFMDAINSFKQAIKFKPNYKEAYYGLGLAYFKSGNNNKAEEAANEALKIDPNYQLARDLLDDIKRSSIPPIVPPSPGNHWQFVVIATLGLALVICLIQMTNIGSKVGTGEITKLKNQLAQKESDIQELNTSIENLKTLNENLNRENDMLHVELEDLRDASNTIPEDVTDQLQLLSETEAALASWINENQKWQSQLDKKDAEIRQLQKNKRVVINENRRLKEQIDENISETADHNAIVRQLQTENRRLEENLVEKTSETKNLTDRVQRLQDEKIERQRHNRRLQGENIDLTHQNRNLRNENEALRNKLDKAKQENSKGVVSPEPPKKNSDYRNFVKRAVSHNNQGCDAFKDGEYDKAIKQFRQAIKTESRLAEAHYNLGCAFLEMEEYRNAISAFNKAIALNQKFKEAYYNRSLTYFRTNQLQKAKQDVTKALGIDRNYRLVQGLLTAIENTQQ